MKPGNPILSRVMIGSLSAIGLVLVFVFQGFNAAEVFGWTSNPTAQFVINRSIRFVVNDLLVIALIYALFVERKYVMFAFYVQIFGMIVFLLPYLVFKIQYPGYNGPLINFIHRLILNPILLLLLIPAFYFQRPRTS